jgi:hypothetical protein
MPRDGGTNGPRYTLRCGQGEFNGGLLCGLADHTV